MSQFEAMFRGRPLHCLATQRHGAEGSDLDNSTFKTFSNVILVSLDKFLFQGRKCSVIRNNKQGRNKKKQAGEK